MLRLPLQPSRYLAIGLALGHLLAVACVLAVPIPWWLRGVLVVLIILSFIHLLLRDVLQRMPTSIIELECDREGGALFKTRSGLTYEARVLGSSFVAANLTIVLLKPYARRGVRAVLVLPDTLAPELFRQLRVWLKWRVGRGVEPEASAGWAGRI